MSKAVYKPKGKAGEYAEWACNFYVGCNNGCEYCYLKKGRGAKVLGGDKPTLKKCFRNTGHAKDVFEKEMFQNLAELRDHCLFFSFSTDPMLEETIELTVFALNCCLCAKIPVKILTKRADWVDGVIEYLNREFHFDKSYLKNIAFGFTLTGHDELEPGASINAERIEAMKKLYTAGFKTFASLEPIITTESTAKMMIAVDGYCDLFMVGIDSGKTYNVFDLRSLILASSFVKSKIYFKDSFLKACKMEREDLPNYCVNRDYNLFKNE